MNINNWEVLELEDSKLYLKEENEILIVDNELSYELKKDEKKIINNRENNLINFDYNFYDNLYKEFLEYSFNLLKPFEIFYLELNKNELDKYIL
tara:strand:+ start:285 stop:566 length:282 start_codon:yes stop_codon:yes gene_type:complete